MAGDGNTEQGGSGLPAWLSFTKDERAIAWARAAAFWAELTGKEGAIDAVNEQIRKARQGQREAGG